ncbi:hypothetical protein [Paenibacillus sp. GP183]|jgi:hypothetical protein|uniref:hypothetical protein n=1 Tax=Paenibacillus sp. GP183 TaxID=1882751 RepID=UPI0008942556|nr:hypothetical protein [Paenibacillus sp. GP183]SEC69692.1 hypothetical protein SAMN05443246_5035 [Paenibacillus sp. GP183]
MICFALLAHKDEEALLQQIRNIRQFNPKDTLIVLYNGGNDPNFGKAVCKSENMLYCPSSRPLQSGKTGRFFYDVMAWLEEAHISYEYLVYTESDVMFINHGFKDLLEQLMKGYDCLVEAIKVEMNPQKSKWTTAMRMWKEWYLWKPFFRSEFFYGTFNPMQVYRHSIIKRMLARIHKPQLEELLDKTNVISMGEMLYLTISMQCGARCQEYPRLYRKYFRYRPFISIDEVKDAKQLPEAIFAHPIKDNSVRAWINSQILDTEGHS